MRRLALSLVVLAGCVSTALAQSAWTTDSLGRTAIFRLGTAPFPHPARSYTDDRVMFFVPDGFRPGSSVDIVVNYHGHGNEIVNSDRGHHYREQLALSKKNAILLEPQGPYMARDSFGGKHEDPQGLARFVNEALALLAREGVVPSGARAGKVVLAGHSGAYRVIGQALAKGGVEVSEVHLNDALYGEEDHVEEWARKPGHKLVSAYTHNGGTVTHNAELERRLVHDGVNVGKSDDDDVLARCQAVFVETDVAHDDVTHARNRWATVLAASGLSDLGCPRPVLRSVRAVDASKVELRWYPVRSQVLRGYRIYGSSDGTTSWARLADESVFGPSNVAAWIASSTTARFFRVTAVDDLGRESEPSSVYGIGPATPDHARVLVVDGFVRTTGAWTRGDHAFAALVGTSIAASGRTFETCSARAVKDGSVALADYASVIWSAGDQGGADAALDHVEVAALRRFLETGGALFVSGSEVAYHLARGAATAADRALLATFHASFAADTSPSRHATATTGPLAGASLDFGGATAVYAPRSPDVLAATKGGEVALRYADGRAAAVAFEGTVGAARSGVLLVGFPVETIDGAASRDALLAKVLDWQDGVNRRAGR